jgi:hypothetical protein
MSITPKPFSELSVTKVSFNTDKLKELTQFILTRDGVDHRDLEDSLKAITRRFDRFPLKGKTLDLYTNNQIQILNNKETVQVPAVLTGWRIKGDNGRINAYINATPYVPSAGIDQLDVRKLFGLLVYGAVLVSTYESWNKISSSINIAKSGSAVYSRMIFKIIDKLTGIGMDRLHSDQVKFVLSKYFLINMLQRSPNESTDTLASGNTLGSANNALIDFENSLALSINASSQAELYNIGFMPFIDALSKSVPWLSRLSARGFIQSYTSIYQPPALLACEDAGYFLALMATHQAGAEIISSFGFDPVYGKEGDDTLDELARLIRN